MSSGNTPDQTCPASTILEALSHRLGVVELDPEGTVRSVNECFAAMLGYAPAEIVGQSTHAFCPPALASSKAYADAWRLLAQGESMELDVLRTAAGGRLVWARSTLVPHLDVTGRLAGVTELAADITEERRHLSDLEGWAVAIDRAQAVIEFDVDGTILSANENFLDTFGYRQDEIRGHHHRLFVDPAEAADDSYRHFWERLSRGEFHRGEFRRLAKDGSAVWIHATYNPIFDQEHRVTKVVKFAVDVTADKKRRAAFEGRVKAIARSQAVIEFDLDGHVLEANDNFLRTMGYSLREIEGQHHAIFCDEDYLRSAEYRDFWLRLRRGEFISGRFRRIGKYSRDVWIQASYNPILDLNGEPVSVVKFAHDVTAEVLLQQAIQQKAGEITGTVERLAEAATAIAGRSREARNLADTTQSDAETGFEAVRASLDAIELLRHSSSEIAQIVRVIGDIANQTNLLAFNASIEAARAGEHGIGFSVVAGEVRKLAERAAESAKDITRLIDESSARVNQGAEVSARARDAFENIVDSVHKTNEAIRVIAESAASQQTTSTEVAALVSELAGKQP